MSNKKETPVSWLVDQFDLNPDSQYIKAVIDHALEMESKKQQKYDEMLAMLIRMRDNDDWGITDLFDLNQLIKEAKNVGM
jgi:hypothetical protein